MLHCCTGRVKVKEEEEEGCVRDYLLIESIALGRQANTNESERASGNLN